MFTVHRLPPQEDGGKPELFAVYSAPDGFDLEQGIHDAGVDFCYGYYKRCGGIETLTNDDFIRLVDNDTCEKYGFSKLIVQNEAEDIDPDTVCVSVREQKHLFAERDEDEKLNTAALEAAKARDTAIRMAIIEIAKKMEASVKRTDSRLARWPLGSKVGKAALWAMEFVDSGATDIDKFYSQKMKRI